jgi:hypothetical protein
VLATVAVSLALGVLAATAGASFTAPVNLSVPGQSAAPQVATDADGDSIAVWQLFDGTDSRIQARTVSAAGDLGRVRDLAGSGQSAKPEVATDADGDSIAVWQRLDDEANPRYRVQARTISAAGALGRVRTLSAVGESATDPQVATDVDGNAIVVWRRVEPAIPDPIARAEARTISPAGVPGPLRRLSPPDQDTLDLRVATDADGDSIAVWRGFDPPPGGFAWRALARTISPTGMLGPIRELSPDAVDTRVATDADGDSIAVWRSYDGSNYRIQARTIPASGAPGPVRTLSGAGEDALDPQVASDSDGDAIAVWRRLDNAAHPRYRIQARTIPAAGALGAIQDLSAAGRDAAAAQVATDADGDSIAVWPRWDGSDYRVQARTIPLVGAPGAVQDVSAAGLSSLEPQVATDAVGDSIVVYNRLNGHRNRVQASLGP